ncbi:MAG: PDZ domain-containing protein [Elusimicrobiota bacterium]|jgi:C-terminal processing protease CtpA/Prc
MNRSTAAALILVFGAAHVAAQPAADPASKKRPVYANEPAEAAPAPKARAPRKAQPPSAKPAPARRMPVAADETPSVAPPRKTLEAPAPAKKRLPAPSLLKPASAPRQVPGRALKEVEGPAIDVGAPDAEESRTLSLAGDPGLLVDERGGGLLVRATLARSFAERLGLRPGDLLSGLGGKRVRSKDSLLLTGASLEPGVRAWAAVQRVPGTAGLETAAAAPPRPSARDPRALTAQELSIRSVHVEESGRLVPATLRSLKTPSFRIAAGESLWIRFPKGIPRTVSEGDVLEGETSSPMTTDANLDFLAIPPGSRVWAQAISVKDSGKEVLLRLHVFKIALAGGHSYPCSALLVDASGDPSLLRVSRGGTIVAAPSDADLTLAAPDRSYLMRLTEPLTTYEAREFYLSGPGLWFKTSGDAKSRTFEVTRVIDKRSAEQAGIRVGDRLMSVDGKSADKAPFQEAIARLYGPAGTSVSVRFMHAGETRGVSASLLRGAVWRSGLGLTVRRDGGSVLVRKTLPDSPAAKAGVKEGDVLLSFGKTDAAGLSEEDLRTRLREELGTENAPTFQTPGKSPRKVPLTRAVFPAAIEPDILGESAK